MEGISRICRRVRLSLESFLPSFFSPSPFSRTRDQCHHQHPFYSNFVHFVSLVQPLVKLLEPPSRVSCVVREYRVLDLSSRTIPPISLLEFSSNRKEEILLFLESKFPRRGNFSQIFILPLQISLLSIFAKNEAKRAKNEKSFYTFSFFLTIFSFFFLFSSLTIPSLCRLSTNVSRKRFTSYHGVTPRRWNTIIRVSPGILEGSFTPFAWVRVTSFTDQLLLSFSFFFFPRKNLVRKCPSVVVKSNPDLISCTSDTFAFLSHSRRE